LINFRAEVAVLTGGKKGKWFGEDERRWSGWENDFRIVVELMEGSSERVLEESSDWREALGAWGILVDVGMKRDDLS
jgi:nuclear pore complex protein Nup85